MKVRPHKFGSVTNLSFPRLDLASAVAISAASVSSSMGRISVGWLGPTLQRYLASESPGERASPERPVG